MASEIMVAGKNLMLNALAGSALYMALYTDVDGITEVSGGGYARKSVSWAAASNGQLITSADVLFDIPAGTTVRKIAVLSAVSGGTKYAHIDPANIETWTGAGTSKVPAGTGFVLNLP